MALTRNGFAQLQNNLNARAQEANTPLTQGLLVGLVNYSQHLGVRDLPESEIVQVLSELGGRAISLARERDWRHASGQALQEALYLLGCGRTYENCTAAAAHILDKTIVIKPDLADELPAAGAHDG